jgi:hypothetical protein
MTQTSPSDSTSDDSKTAGSADWDSVIEEWRKYGDRVVDRLADRAKENLDLARGGKYNRNAWLDDVKWFWTNVAADAAQGVEYARNNWPGTTKKPSSNETPGTEEGSPESAKAEQSRRGPAAPGPAPADSPGASHGSTEAPGER